MVKLTLGVGVNDADYVVKVSQELGIVDGKRKKKLLWVCPFYMRWRNMLQRCYSEDYHKKTPTYKGCSVCEEWKYFSKFKAWMETQDWQGKELDKDLLFPKNKLYSPNTCVFVDRIVNSFLVERDASRGEFPIGVYWSKWHNKYMARCQNPFTGKYEYLGVFIDPEEAHQAWLKRKQELAQNLASMQTDTRIALALINRYTDY